MGAIPAVAPINILLGRAVTRVQNFKLTHHESLLISGRRRILITDAPVTSWRASWCDSFPVTIHPVYVTKPEHFQPPCSMIMTRGSCRLPSHPLVLRTPICVWFVKYLGFFAPLIAFHPERYRHRPCIICFLYF